MRGWHLETALLQGSTVTHTSDDSWQGAGGLPMLILQADSDTIAPRSDAADALKREYGERLQISIINNAGHALLPEAPRQIEGAVLAYLARLVE